MALSINPIFKLVGRRAARSVNVYVSYDCSRIVLSTGITVNEADWDSVRQMVRSSDPAYKTKREKLNQISEKLEDPVNGIVSVWYAENEMMPSILEVKAELKKFLIRMGVKSSAKKKTNSKSPQRDLADTPRTFFYWADEYINGLVSGKERKPDGSLYSKDTIKGYKSSLKNLKEYKPDLKFQAVNKEFGKKYLSWLFDVKEMKVNSAGKNIRNFKTFMEWAWDKKLHLNRDFDKMPTPVEEVDAVYCNEEQLKVIAALKLSGTEEVVRDRFIIGCYTGLRISDLSQLSETNLREGQIAIENQKTKIKVIINLHPLVKQVLDKWGGLPDAVADQTFNRIIKEVIKKAGYDGPVEVKTSKGGVKNKERHPFHTLVSSHTCRRSCATNMYLAGVPVQDIMKVTGHKSEKSFFMYVKVTLQETADRLKEHAFYKEQRGLEISHKKAS
jgi:integrase